MEPTDVTGPTTGQRPDDADPGVPVGAFDPPAGPTTPLLPATIRVAATLTPNEMRHLKASTGRSLNDLLGGDADDMEQAPDRIQSLVWVALRRAGYDCTWDEAGDVAPDTSAAPADPTGSASSNGSSTSAAGGA